MTRIILLSLFFCSISMLSFNAQAQTEINSLAEISSLDEGTVVKVNLKDVHTSAFTYDPWGAGATLYMQDETTGVIFYGLSDITAGKTLNGYIYAETKKEYDTMALSATTDTNIENITQTDWDYSGVPTVTIADINEGSAPNMLVTLENLTSSSTGSDYYLTLSDGTDEIDLYNDLDQIKLSKVPEHIKSISALCVADAWTGGYYLVGISQDLIKDADAPEDARLIKTIAELADANDGEEVLVTLKNAYTTATLDNKVFLEDATAGTIFYDCNIASGKVVNGEIYAVTTKVGNDICLRVDGEKTDFEQLDITDGIKEASNVYLNGALSSFWHNRLVVLSDVQSIQNDDSWTLTQGEAQMEMKDTFSQLADFEVPQYIKSLTGIVMYDAASDAYIIAPTDKDLIIEGEAPVEPTGIAAVKLKEGGSDFELILDNAKVTSATYYTDDDGNELASYIIEDETGGLLMQQYPQDYGWQPGDRVSGAVYGTVNTDNTAYGMDVMALPNDETYESLEFDITHGNLIPTVVSVSEALTSRYYNCYVKVENVSKTTGTMTFYGQELEYNAVTDGTAKILFDDGWEVLPTEWQNELGVCQLPDDVKALAGHVEPYFGVTFMYPTSESDVTTTTGIKDIHANFNTNIYSISGQRLSQPRKGINIINGRKVCLP